MLVPFAAGTIGEVADQQGDGEPDAGEHGQAGGADPAEVVVEVLGLRRLFQPQEGDRGTQWLAGELWLGGCRNPRPEHSAAR